MPLMLKDLAKEKGDISEFGLKTEGLVELINRNTGKYVVDKGFAISENEKVEGNRKVEEISVRLTRGPEEPKLIIARSSDRNESPGKFESHTCLWDPKKPEKYVGELIEAIEKVRDSGAGGVACQVMANTLSREKFYMMDDERKPQHFQEPCFGGEDTGFVFKSHTYLKKNHSIIYSTRGLTSALVGKISQQQNVSIIFNGPEGTKCLNLKDSYLHSSQNGVKQDVSEIIRLADPSQILQVTYDYDNYKTWCSRLPGENLLADVCNPLHFDYDEDIFSFFRLLESLKTGNEEAEIEGCMLSHPLGETHLHQLRKYSIPKERDIIMVELQEPLRGIIGMEDAYVSDRFSGNLVVLQDTEGYDISEGDIILPLFITEIGSLETNQKFNYLCGEFVKKPCRGMIVPTRYFGDKYHEATHSFGSLIQTLHELQNSHPVIGINKNDAQRLQSKIRMLEQTFPNNVERRKYGAVLRDVCVECDGEQAQIYWAGDL